MSDLPFSTLTLNPSLLKNIDSLGFTQMTPVQAKSLLVTLKCTDFIAQVKTGSGKTAAFALALLSNLNVEHFTIKEVGKINIVEFHSYVAIKSAFAKQALNILSEGKIKGRAFRARLIT